VATSTGTATIIGTPMTLAHGAGDEQPDADERRGGHPEPDGQPVLHEDHRSEPAEAVRLAEAVLVVAVDDLWSCGDILISNRQKGT
jgi:hypothetical protein